MLVVVPAVVVTVNGPDVAPIGIVTRITVDEVALYTTSEPLS